MVEVYGQVSSDGKRWAALIVAAAVLAGCGSVTASGEDAAGAAGSSGHDAGPELAAAGTTGSAGTSGAGGTTGAAGSAHDAGTPEVPPAIAKCGGTMTIGVGDENMGAGQNLRCKDYRPGLRCVALCRDELGIEHPTAAEPTTCEASGLPIYNGAMICVRKCADCPPI